LDCPLVKENCRPGGRRVLRRLAEAGNAHIMYRVGRIYSMGPASLRDEAEGVRWYRRAADAGNASGMTALAMALLQAEALNAKLPAP